LPSQINAGNIIQVTIERVETEERVENAKFLQFLDSLILKYGNSPEKPQGSVEFVGDTFVILRLSEMKSWNCKVRGIDILKDKKLQVGSYRAPEIEYSFNFYARTTAGRIKSDIMTVKTLSSDDFKCLNLCISEDDYEEDSLKALKILIKKIGANVTESLSLANTHLIANEPAGQKHDQAIRLGVPIVKKSWLEACEEKFAVLTIKDYLLHSPENPSSP
ncbi:hypothetical protein ROZALSC1DRAFT_27638, partial [Rozella allomycis CSF55]